MSALAGQRVLVTGTHRGIGAACAMAFAAAGAWVICADRRLSGETVATIRAGGGKAEIWQCDVTDPDSVEALFDALGEAGPAPQALVHCAGISHEGGLLETGIEDFDRLVATNLRGTFLVGQAAIRMMRPAGGRVILLASDLGHRGAAGLSAYAATKHAVMGLVRSWALEFAPGITVNALCPGPVDARPGEPGPHRWRLRTPDAPMRRLAKPDEVAAAAVFLAGPGGAFITGQGIGVNGGSAMP